MPMPMADMDMNEMGEWYKSEGLGKKAWAGTRKGPMELRSERIFAAAAGGMGWLKLKYR